MAPTPDCAPPRVHARDPFRPMFGSNSQDTCLDDTYFVPVSTLSPTPWRLLTSCYWNKVPSYILLDTLNAGWLLSWLSFNVIYLFLDQQMDLYRQINNYFDTTKYSEWSILDCLYSIQNPTFTSDSADEVATIIKNIIKSRRISNSILANARRKLEHLESKFEFTWTNSEVQQYFNRLDLSHINVSVKSVRHSGLIVWLIAIQIRKCMKHGRWQISSKIKLY